MRIPESVRFHLTVTYGTNQVSQTVVCLHVVKEKHLLS